ncbi:hypothetical protein FRC03_011214 [Tulasnella sp. 419]|nr:hypothetical protein FRC03_011214 [Tulasnella sp. 419]
MSGGPEIEPVLMNQSTVPVKDDPAMVTSDSYVTQVKSSSQQDNAAISDMDLMTRVKGMYRLLDLYKEQGSGGFVDKVLIAQNSLEKLMNKLVPRSFVSPTRINFASLDTTSIQPLGIYGDKSALVHFLHLVAKIDDETAKLLMAPTDTTSLTDLGRSTLPSRLYFLLPDVNPSSVQEAPDH